MSGVRQTDISPVSLIVLLSLCLVLSSCTTSGVGGVAGVEVTGERGSIHVQWDPDHPWAKQFRLQPGRFRLYAQYRSGGEPVEQEIAAASLAGQAAWVFQLPQVLRAPPDAQVCIFISQAQGAQGVPVRPAGKGSDTARFRYVDWESSVRAATSASTKARTVEILQTNLSGREAALAALKDSMRAAGISAQTDCQRGAVEISPAVSESVPRDVVSVPNQSAVAEKVCVRRARNMRRFRQEYRVDLADTVSKLSADATLGPSDRLRSLAAKFSQHWNRWHDSVGVEYLPEVGSANDGLPTVGIVDEAIVAWNKAGSSGSAQQRRTIAAGLLDAYEGCLEDVRKQLNVKYEAWRRAQVNQPLRDRQYAERQRAECVAKFNELQTLTRTIEEMRRDLGAKRLESASASKAPLSLPGGRVSLNELSCSI